MSRAASFTPKQYYSTLPYRDNATINFMTTNFPSPFFGLYPNFTSKTMTRAQLLAQYPHFSSVTYEDSVGYSWYHSMQNRLEKRFSQGWTLQLSWTWSKAMAANTFLNPFDSLPYESISDLDRLHRVTGSGIYELPFGRGRKFGSSMPRPLEFLAGGWQLSGMWQFQSGEPLRFGDALFIDDSRKIVLPSDKRNVDRWFNTDVFNRNPAQQLSWNVRTSPLRNSNIRSDSQRRLDLSARKTFRVTEKLQAIFRGDVFNARNEVVLRAPNTPPSTARSGG